MTSGPTPRGSSTDVDALRSAGSNPVIRGFPEGAIVVFDDELRYVTAGGEGLAIVGLTRSDIEGKTIFEVFPDEVSSVLEQPYRDALKGGEATLDVRFGSRTFLHRIAPLRDEHEEIIAGIGFALDVTAARESERALRASESSLIDERRRLRSAEDIGHAGSWEWDLVSDVITWSEGLFQLHGLEREDFPGGYGQAASRVYSDDRQLVDNAIAACRRGESVHFRYRVARASDGDLRWFDSHASGVVENGEVVRLVGAVADVTEFVAAEQEVVDANAFMKAVLLASPDYTFITDLRTGAMVYGSKDRNLLGRTTDEAGRMGKDAIAALVHPDDQEAVRGLNTAAVGLEDDQVLEMRYRLRHADGEWHWMSRHVVPFRRDSSGSVIEVLGVIRDVTDVVLAEERLTHDALHDELTGLPNRSLLLDRLHEAIARSVRDGRDVAVLYCDLDGFKNVNDSAGHAAGDAVLIETADRLRGALRDGDTIARMGGDEFVVVIDPWNRHDADGFRSHRDSAEARALSLDIAERIVKAMTQPISFEGQEFLVTVSIGVAYASASSPALEVDSADQVIREADEALYRAKRDGKNLIRVFNEK
jgi:diguanylate cyclase (GGDEF)-like protein/PAS domain S-box-containing protein